MRLRWIFLLALLLVVGVAPLGIAQDPSPAANVGEDGLPTTEKALLAYARKHQNRSKWVKSEQAYKALLKRYPQSANRPEVLFRLGQLHLYASKRYSLAAPWLDKLIAESPKNSWAWQGRSLRAETHARMHEVDKAVALFRSISNNAPNASQRSQAAQRVLSVQNKYFSLSVRQSFSVGEMPTVSVNSRNIGRAQFRMERVPYDGLLEHLGPKNLDIAAAAVATKERLLVREWEQNLRDRKNNWQQNTIDLLPVDGGVYLVTAVVDGVTFRVSVIVNTLGLIAKSHVDGVLVFAQERRYGSPMKDVRVRLLSASGTTEATTNAEGICKLSAARSGGLLIGAFGKEYAFCSVTASARGAAESRIYVTTDRPLYRPGHEVHFKILHREDDDNRFKIHEGLRVRATIRDNKGNVVHIEDLTLGKFGSAHGQFTLAATPSLGNYDIRVSAIDPLPGQSNQWGNQWANRGTFRVDEYRKPEFRVDVAFRETRYVQGDRLKATVSARYFFGSPVSGAKVTWTIHQSRKWTWWGGRPAWMDWYGDSKRSYHGGGERVAQGEGFLDANGDISITAPLPRADYDQSYTIEAHVTDLARRKETGVGSVPAYQSAVAVRIQTDRSVVLPGQKLVARIDVRDHDHQVVANQRVEIVAYRRVWSWFRKKYREHELQREVVTTNAKGRAVFEMRIESAGSIVLRASAADANKNKTHASRWLWVTKNDWDGGAMNWRGLSIVPDKESYEPGETATFLLTSEVKDLHLLFTLECRRLYHHQVVKMNGHTATITVKLDNPGMLPNFFATVTGMHANKTYQRQINVVVNPSERFLNVSIRPDKAQYKPGQPAKFEITTTNANGEPVAAEVELAAIDEALYSLQAEYAQDIRKFFLRRRWNSVATNSSVQYWDSGLASGSVHGEGVMEESRDDAVGAPRKSARSMASGLAGAKKKGFVEPKVRAKFADTLLWVPSVVTDATGKATVEIPELADNLTTWRLTARGMSASGHMGQQREKILVRKEVIARLQLPRFFTQGDRAVLTAIVRNDLDVEKEMKIVLEVDGLPIEGETTVFRKVGPKQEVRVEWRARVERPGTATFTLKAMTDTESDALVKKVPVLPHGSLSWTSSSGILSSTTTETVTLNPDSMPESSQLTIDLVPTHAATVLDALDYLADYPYGCVEQTMSRFLPSTTTRQVLRRMEIKKPWLEKELPKMIDAGLRRLANFQHADGGWGWWKKDESNPFTTAYVVYGLAMARRADVMVNSKMFNRGTKALRRMLPDVETSEERVYILHSLAVAGIQVKGVRNAVADGAAKLPPAAKAMLALVLHMGKEPAEAKRVLALLAKDANASGATAFWNGKDSWRWAGHRIEATALALEAYLAIAPDDKIVPKIAAWLALQRDGGYWVSTRQTAMVVMAMSKYLVLTGAAAPDMTITLDVNGKRLWEKKITPQNWATFDGRTVLPAAELKTGENKITITKTGSGAPVYSIFLRQFKHRAKFEPSTGDLRVHRRYDRIVNGKLVPLLEGDTIRSGDEISVTLTVRSDRPRDFLMLEDPMPSGFEAIRDAAFSRAWRGLGRWSYWWSNRELRDEKVDIAITHMYAGERKVSYRMRAEQPGFVRVLPTRIWNMYRPGEGANGASMSFEVVAR